MFKLPGPTCGYQLGPDWIDSGTMALTRMPSPFSPTADSLQAPLHSRLTALEHDILTALDLAGIWTVTERAMFFAQMSVESAGFTRLKEDMSRYTARNVEKIWNKYFPGPGSAAAAVEAGSDALANIVYGPLHKGLGNTQPGDGAKFIGRGYTQLTGRHNYTAAAKALQLDLVAHPELAEQPANAIRIAIWFWKENNCGAPAVREDIEAVTRIVNGGQNGLTERRRLYVLYSRRLADEQAPRPTWRVP